MIWIALFDFVFLYSFLAKQESCTKLEESATSSGEGDTVVKITSKDDVILKEVHLHSVEKS